MLPLCLVISSCGFALSSFTEIPEAKRDMKVTNYMALRKQSDRKMPDNYTFTITRTTGTEEGRNPLFGRIIYKQGTTTVSKATVAYQSDVFYFHYGYSTNNGKTEEKNDVYIYVNGTNLISYYSGKDVSPTGAATYVEVAKYSSKYQAGSDFVQNVSSFAKNSYFGLVEQFDAEFDKIPTLYNPDKAAEDLQSYKAFERQTFPSDIKLELNEFFSEDHTLGRAYYTAVATDFLPYYFRSVNRARSSGGYKVSEIEMSYTQSVTLIRPKYDKVDYEYSSSYSSSKDTSSSASSSSN